MRRTQWNGASSVILSSTAYGRLFAGRQKAEMKLSAMRDERMRTLRKPSLELRMATAALLVSAAGVFASKVPLVLAVTARYHLGHIPAKRSHISTSTALDYVRTLGFCLQQQLLQRIGVAKAHFCIGTKDTTYDPRLPDRV